MIGRLTGTVLEKSLEQVLLDVNGVAYEVEIPQPTFDALPGVGDATVLHTHLVVREDAQLLYGFATLRERDMFRTLIKVNKVGPKLGIAILSGVAVNDLIAAIRNGDVKTINGISGVGKVTAERVIMEMKNKIGEWETDLPDLKIVGSEPVSDVMADAEAALIELGYRPQEASRALAQVEDTDGDVSSIIRQALRGLA